STLWLLSSSSISILFWLLLPPAASHIPVVASKLPVATIPACLEKATLRIVRLWPSLSTSAQLHGEVGSAGDELTVERAGVAAGLELCLIAHKRTVWSPLQLASSRPVLCQQTCQTRSWWPGSSATSSSRPSVAAAVAAAAVILCMKRILFL